MLFDAVSRLRETCAGIVEIDEPTRINPLDRAAYPVVTVHLANERPASAAIGEMDLIERRYEVRITSKSLAQLDDARAQVMSALHQWRAPGSAKPMRWIGGELVALDGPYLQWRDQYELARCL